MGTSLPGENARIGSPSPPVWASKHQGCLARVKLPRGPLTQGKDRDPRRDWDSQTSPYPFRLPRRAQYTGHGGIRVQAARPASLAARRHLPALPPSLHIVRAEPGRPSSRGAAVQVGTERRCPALLSPLPVLATSPCRARVPAALRVVAA